MLQVNEIARVRAVAGEFAGTAFLLAAVVGSGIMGERLAGGNVAIALLANALATGAALVALIVTFGPVSGAHFNPAVTLADASQGGLPWNRAAAYVVAQFIGAILGVMAAHLMFGEPVVMVSTRARSGVSQIFSVLSAVNGSVRLSVIDEAMDGDGASNLIERAQPALDAARAAGAVNHFGFERRTLAEVFLDIVGREVTVDTATTLGDAATAPNDPDLAEVST